MIVIVGSRGWIGSSLGRRLNASQINWIPSHILFGNSSQSQLLDFTWTQKFLFKGNKITKIINCAASGSNDQEHAHYLNLTKVLSYECQDHSIKYIHIGSAAEFGNNSDELIESSAKPLPITQYGEIKHLASSAALSNGGFVVRPFNVVGPNQSVSTPVGEWMAKIKSITNQHTIEIGNSTLVRDYISLNYLTEILCELTILPTFPRQMNICSGVGTTLGEMLDALILVSGRSINVEKRSFPGIPRVVGNPFELKSIGLYKPENIFDLARTALKP